MFSYIRLGHEINESTWTISVYIIRMLLLRHDPLMWSSFGPNDLIEENPRATVV